MNRCTFDYEQNAMIACEEMRMESVVCPKPRRLGVHNGSLYDQIRPFRWRSHQTEIEDSRAGPELLDVILSQESCGEKWRNQIASSPPYFCGSPPSRASNPVIQDEQFGNEEIAHEFCPPSPPPLSPSTASSSARKGCVRMKIGHKPAAVRVEGFDCLSRDRRNCSIFAMA